MPTQGRHHADLVILAAVCVFALFVLGWFPAALVTRSPLWATVTAPLATGVLAATWVSVMVLVRAPFTAVVAAVVVTSAACAVPVLRDRPRYLARPPKGWAWVLVVPAAGIAPLTTVRLSPVAWDARSIWWFHARWFAAGGDVTADALQHRVFDFAHQDYPPLASATSALGWWFTGSQPLRAAHIGTAILTLSAVVTFGAVIWRLATPRLSAAGAALGVLVVLGAYGVTGVGNSAPAVGTNGYVDLLQAAALTAAAVALLVAPVDDDDATRIGALCLAVSAATKNEGLVAALVVGVIALLRARERRRTFGWVAVAFVPAALWAAVLATVDVRSEADRQRIDELLRLDRIVTDRFDPTMDALWDQMWPLLVATLVVTVVGLVVFRRGGRPPDTTATGSLWLVWGTTSIALLLAYVVSPLPIGFHLVSSVDRTTIMPKLLLVAIVVTWTVVGVLAISDRIARATRDETPIAATTALE
jgi:hypothetical protein